jgi:hypothetical protein
LESICLDLKVNRPQAEFLALPHKYRAFVAGYGTGKTWVGCLDQCLHFWKHPGINQGYFAPTYPQIRDIFYPTIEEVAYTCGLDVTIKEANKEVEFYSGRQYRGTTICRSLERPQTIVGFKIGNAQLDEFDLIEPAKAEIAWRKIIARMRYNDASLRNGVAVTTTPEGFRATHKLFVEALTTKPDLVSSYGLVHASTYENATNLPADYISSLEDAYPEQLIDAYLNGQFTNLRSGTVYRSFHRVKNGSEETVTPGDVLHIGMDFNVQHMAATVYVQRENTQKDGLHAVSEFKEVFDTPDMIAAIKSRHGSHKCIVYPDASGNSRRSVDASVSDISLLRQAGFEIEVNSTNPAVKDRINATEKQFQVGKLWVNATACPTTARCLEQQAYDDNGEPDKRSGFDHQNDATTYPVAFLHPIVHRHTSIRPLRL